MIAKGNLHGDGAKLAAYLMTGEDGEIAQLIETRGLEGFGGDPMTAFAALQQVAEAQTNCTQPFFHTQTRLAPGEHLTDAQWLEVADREEKRLGFSGQPRILSFHIDPQSGEKHLHAAWFRIDLETMHAIDPGMFKNHLKQVARKAERDFALREVSNTRKPEDRARIADRNEVEESRRLGTDVRAIRTAILGCLEQSDSGKAFKAALEAQGLMLANGDRRDCFVVIDAAGGQHALNKKLTGQTLAATRDRLADLDRTQLPGVEQAQAQQAENLAVRAAQTGRQRPDPAVEVENTPAAARGPYAPLNEAEAGPKIRPLGKTAGEIRLAWQLTQTGPQFAERLEDRGLILVYVSAEQAKASERAKEFAKAIDRQSRALREGFAVVDQRGTVTRVDQRATGDQWEVIQKRLGGIDRAELPTVAEGREHMRAANRADWLQQRQAARAEERTRAPVPESLAPVRMAWMLSRNADQFREALAVRGMGLGRVTADEAYVSERAGALAKDAGNFAPVFKEGEIVAVNGFGRAIRLDERTTGQLQSEIDLKLSGIDRAGLATMTAAQAQQIEIARASWRADREQARPPSWIENVIAGCDRDAPASVVQNAEGRTLNRAEILGERFKAEDERTAHVKTVFGAEAFAARLDEAGIAIVRVTHADIPALAAWRHDEDMKLAAADTNGESYRNRRIAPDLEPGQLAAVTRNGDVYAINPTKIGNAARQLPADLPSVTEAHSRFTAERADIDTHWQLKQADIEAGQRQREGDRQTGRTAATAERAVEAAIDTPAAAIGSAGRKTGKLASAVTKVFETGFNLLFGGFMAAPKQTPQQVRDEAQAAGNVETLHARDVAADQAAAEAAHDWRAHSLKNAQQEQDLRRSQIFGTNPTAEANLGRDDYDRERERER